MADNKLVITVAPQKLISSDRPQIDQDYLIIMVDQNLPSVTAQESGIIMESS